MLLKQCTILFAEDEQRIRENVQDVLSLVSKKVFTASNGLEALEIFAKVHLDILILDIEMPHLNGLEVAKKVRETNREIPIIICTAYSTQEYLLQAVELNLSTYILKPITIDNLKEALTKAQEKLTVEAKDIFYFNKDIFYSFSTNTLYLQKEEIILRKLEIQFLEYMIKNPNRVITYEEFESNIWEEEGMSSSAIRSVVCYLRKYLPKEIIINIARVGYKLKVEK